jgi:protein-tyrosine phosphatase
MNASSSSQVKRPWRRAAGWLALLAPLFYLSYGLANYLAAGRASVPSIVFDWERGMPFWAWTIFPYWSINVFYGLSLFTARNRFELDRHGARLLTAQLMAVSCFIIWPLRYSFGQPEADGAAGFMFAALRGFDQPFNQAPSLHIALAVILWDWYRRRITPVWARVVLHVWALAICGSVLTTYQHHFIDIPTGALLGVVCVWLWPLERRVALLKAWRLTRDPQRGKLAGFYALGAVASAWIGIALGGVALWLCWPAAALLAVALNYAGFGARGFQMGRDGGMAWAARWLLMPYRMGAAINAWLWTHRQPAASVVQPGILLGRVPTAREWHAAGRPLLLSLCAELQLPAEARADARCLPLLDLVVPPPALLSRAAGLLQRQARQGEGVWICCALGYSRSAAAVVSWLCATGQARNTDHAQAMVRSVRPQIVLRRPWQMNLLRAADVSQCRSHT